MARRGQTLAHERLRGSATTDANTSAPSSSGRRAASSSRRRWSRSAISTIPCAGKYTVDRYLDDLEKRYGGIDACCSGRSIRTSASTTATSTTCCATCPAASPDVRQMIADFHRRGVRVLFPVMPWDTGTRDEGEPLWTTAAKLMAEVGADGINGDTISGMPRDFRTASDATGHIRSSSSPRTLSVGRRRRLAEHDLGLLEVSVRAHGQQVQVARAAAHGQRLPALGARQDRRPAVRLLQRRRLRELGEHLGHLEPDHSPRCRGAAAHRHDRAAVRRSAGQPDWEPHTPTLQYGVFASKWPGSRRRPCGRW